MFAKVSVKSGATMRGQQISEGRRYSPVGITRATIASAAQPMIAPATTSIGKCVPRGT